MRKKAHPAENSLKAVHKTRLYEQIVGQIQALIKEGKLQHGDQLPTERRLAEIFHVSRHSVREAIRILEEKNILRSRVGSGTYVITEDEPSVVEFLAQAINREKEKVAEVFQIRRMLEPQIAALAAVNASEHELHQLEEIVARQEASMANRVLSTELDKQFHLLLTQAAGNSVLIRIMKRINDIVMKSRTEMSRSSARRQKSLRGHAAILEALRRKDASAAATAMERHLESIEGLVIHHVG